MTPASPRPHLGRALAAGALAFAVLGGMAPAAHSSGPAATGATSYLPPTQSAATHLARRAADSPDTLAWSVRPTPTDDESDRTSFFLDVEEGQTIEDSIRIRNLGKTVLPLNLYATDARTTETGNLDLPPAIEKPTDVGAWIEMESTEVRVKPGETVDVPFTMRVPDKAEAGDHTGGIVTSYVAPGSDANGQAVTLDQRLASRVAVRVDGELRPALAISGLDVGYAGNANPAGRGDLELGYTVTNTGNARLSADQIVNVDGLLGLAGRTATLNPMPEVLPGNHIRVKTKVSGIWPTIRAGAQLELRPLPTRPDDTFPALKAASASVGIWAVPWSLLLLLLLAAGGAGGFLLAKNRAKERENRRVAAAVRARLHEQEPAEPAAPSFDSRSL